MDQPKPQLLKLIDHVRAPKTPLEIFHIASGANILEEVFSRLKDFLRPKLTELEVALFLEKQMASLRVREVAFCPIVASGSNTAHIHHWPTNRKIQKGDMVMVDFGAVVDGYCSDMTRMLFLGKPSKRQERVYNAVFLAQATGLKKIKAGMSGGHIDAAVRHVLKRYKLNKNFTHNLGHGVGQYIHEWPRLGKKSKDVLEPNMVVTLEPGVYIKGWGGIRIEDMVRVSAGGCEVLTQAPKDLKSAIISC